MTANLTLLFTTPPSKDVGITSHNALQGCLCTSLHLSTNSGRSGSAAEQFRMNAPRQGVHARASSRLSGALETSSPRLRSSVYVLTVHRMRRGKPDFRPRIRRDLRLAYLRRIIFIVSFIISLYIYKRGRGKCNTIA